MEQQLDLNQALEFIIGQLEELRDESTDPGLLLFYNDLKDNHLWLDGPICYDGCAFIIKWLLAADRDVNNSDPVYIHIMSGGGEVDITFTLYEIIKNMRRPVITINEGRCHSGAFIIFLAGKTRLMRKYSQFIAHEGSAEMEGTHKEIEQATAAYNIRVEKMREIISSETGITLEQLRDHFDRKSDWYIDYEQAKQYGIIRNEDTLTIPGYAEV